MSDRSKIVSALLRMSHQIVTSEEFARDAAVCATAAHASGHHHAAASLRSMILARKAEVLKMRRVMTRLTARLANMPIEAD